jgi:hypothetical protein
MTAYSGNTAVNDKTLVANTVDYVSLANAGSAAVNIINESGTAEIFVTFASGTANPTAPTVGGNDCTPVPALAGEVVTIPVSAGPVVIALISSGTPTYSVVALA